MFTSTLQLHQHQASGTVRNIHPEMLFLGRPDVIKSTPFIPLPGIPSLQGKEFPVVLVLFLTCLSWRKII